MPDESGPPPRRRGGLFGWITVGLIGLTAAAGWVEWEVSWAAPWVAASVSRWTGGSVEIGRLWVTPWRGLRAQDLKVRPPGGGWLHAQSFAVRYRPSDVWRGRAATQWRIDTLRLDPGSWKIRRAGAVTLLSEGPIVGTLYGTVSVGFKTLRVESLRVRGGVLRASGAGVWKQGNAHWWVRGQVASPVLEALGIRKTRGAWESFEYRVEGPVRRPTTAFRSRFLSLTLKPNGGAS